MREQDTVIPDDQTFGQVRGEQFVADPLSESAKQDVGEFYHRRRGLGTRMMQRAMTIVADKRPAFDLWVEEDNKEAIALCAKFPIYN